MKGSASQIITARPADISLERLYLRCATNGCPERSILDIMDYNHPYTSCL